MYFLKLAENIKTKKLKRQIQMFNPEKNLKRMEIIQKILFKNELNKRLGKQNLIGEEKKKKKRSRIKDRIISHKTSV